MLTIDVSMLMSSIARIRNAADCITTSGHENRELITFIYNSCNELLKQLGTAMEDYHKQNGETERKEKVENGADKNAG